MKLSESNSMKSLVFRAF